MLLITLYQNCRLNNNYTDGFCDGTRFNEYLDSLVHTNIIAYNTYAKENGMFNFDYSLTSSYDIYHYNYCVIQVADENENVKFGRACFIDKIEILNDIVYCYYSEDIWHSYHNLIEGNNPSVLSSLRVKDGSYYNNVNIPIYSLPVEYDGNNKVSEPTQLIGSLKYALIVQYQIYNTTATGGIAERDVSYALIKIDDDYAKANLSDILSAIDTLEYRKQVTGAFNWTSKSAISTRQYDITEFFIVPCITTTIENLINIFNTVETGYVTGVDEETDYSFLDAKNSNNPDSAMLLAISFQNDFKNRAVGTFSNPIAITNNGSTVQVELNCYVTRYSFNIYMNIQNKLYEVTNQYKLNLPYGYSNSEVLAQEGTKNALNLLSNIADILI